MLGQALWELGFHLVANHQWEQVFQLVLELEPYQVPSLLNHQLLELAQEVDSTLED